MTSAGRGPRRLRLRHVTTMTYAGQVLASYNEARMTPLTTPTQTTLEATVAVDPAASTLRYWDYWGTQVTAFDVQVPHSRLVVTAAALVETSDPVVVTDGPSWDVLHAPETVQKYAEWLAPTPRTVVGPEAEAVARDVAGDAEPAEVGPVLARWLPTVLEYVPGATGVHTSAEESWDVRQGVCQDFAHIVVGLLRLRGIPARYVSGYLHPDPDAPVGETVRGESHAWLEWWAGSWQAWDPTNGKPVDADHVLIGRGRDYGDVPPLKGIYSGEGGSDLSVTVEVTRVA